MNRKQKASQPDAERSSSPRHRRSGLGGRLALWCAVGLGLAGLDQSPAQPFRIESFQLGRQSPPSFSVTPDTNVYYRLLGGEQTTNVQTVISLSLSNNLVAPQAPANAAQFFYRAQRVDLAAPHDSDGDGIDDLWEIEHGLDPLDPSDAAQLAPGDTRTSLEAYTDQRAATFDYQYPTGQGTFCEALAQDPVTGVVYSAGFTTSDDGVNRVLALKSTDGGITWGTDPPLLDYTVGTNAIPFSMALVADASGNLYAAVPIVSPNWWESGNTNTAGLQGLIVLKGVGGGTNWSLIDSYAGEPSWGTIKFFDFVSAAADRDGNVYVAGRANESKTYCQECPNIQDWFVRKFTASSNSWTTVGIFQCNYGGWPTAITCDPTGNVFVVGLFSPSLNNSDWAVRRSTDGGASWKTADTFQLGVPGNGQPGGVTTDAKGNVYVVGLGWRSGVEHWLVRASTDGGNTWRTIDDLPFDDEGGAFGIAVDSTGRLNVHGTFRDNSNVVHSLLRRSSDGGGTWVNTDDFVYSDPSYFLTPEAILGLSDGSILTAGWAAVTGDAPQTGRWLVRRLPPPPPR